MKTSAPTRDTIYGFAFERAKTLEGNGHLRTAECCRQAAKRFSADVGNCKFTKIDKYLLETWIERMKSKGLAPNTVDFYFRALRSVFKRAVYEEVFVDTKRPFDVVHTRTEPTIKRALTREQLLRVRDMELEGAREIARDVFMLSFYLRGIPPIDLRKIKRTDIINGVLHYRRSKTTQRLDVRIEPEAQAIIKKLTSTESELLLKLPHQWYIGKCLRDIGAEIGLPFHLSLYCARHTWATLAQRNSTPLSIISQGLGHSNETTTRIYLAGIECGEVDRYNRKLIRSLMKKPGEKPKKKLATEEKPK